MTQKPHHRFLPISCNSGAIARDAAYSESGDVVPHPTLEASASPDERGRQDPGFFATVAFALNDTRHWVQSLSWAEPKEVTPAEGGVEPIAGFTFNKLTASTVAVFCILDSAFVP